MTREHGHRSITAVIELRRENGWVDGLRAWKVLIDGAIAGSILRRRTETFEVPPGEHTIQLKISLWGSHPLPLILRAGERAILTCRPRDRLWQRRETSVGAILAEASRWNERIVLERPTPADGGPKRGVESV